MKRLWTTQGASVARAVAGPCVLKKDVRGQDKPRFCTHCADIRKKYQLEVKANG